MGHGNDASNSAAMSGCGKAQVSAELVGSDDAMYQYVIAYGEAEVRLMPT